MTESTNTVPVLTPAEQAGVEAIVAPAKALAEEVGGVVAFRLTEVDAEGNPVSFKPSVVLASLEDNDEGERKVLLLDVIDVESRTTVGTLLIKADEFTAMLA